MKISKQKREKISEQILTLLFQSSPKPLFTAHISREIARDEEFTKNILKELLKKGLVSEVKKNKEGIQYLKRSRWILSSSAYEAYRKYQ